MTTLSPSRHQRIATAATVLTVIAIAAGVLVGALTMGVPEAWWPHTGLAFATDAHTAHHNPCDLIVGPAKAYCERGAKNTDEHHGAAAAAWRLVPAGAGLAALLVWRSRNATGRRRR
ncbi:hypothetical protein ACWC2T_39965 [Streptomyces sp. NPDC001393]